MFFSFAFCTFFKIFHVRLGEKSKSVSFLRVYVCVKAKLTLVSFFYFFFAPSPNAKNMKSFKVNAIVKHEVYFANLKIRTKLHFCCKFANCNCNAVWAKTLATLSVRSAHSLNGSWLCLGFATPPILYTNDSRQLEWPWVQNAKNNRNLSLINGWPCHWLTKGSLRVRKVQFF